MAGFYKLIFDLTVYYTLTGFYLNLFLKAPASMPGFALLCLTVGLHILARYKNVPAWCRRCTLLLPALTAVVWPGFWSFAHMLPAGVYAARSLETERIGTDYRTFRGTFLFGLRLQLICMPGLILSTAGMDAALAGLPYLLMLLAVGVCCLRCLRQGASVLHSGLWMAAFLTFCLLLTLGGIPDLLLRALGWVYNEIIIRLLQAAGAVLLLVISFVVQVIADLSRIQPSDKEPTADMGFGSVQQMLGIQEQLPNTDGKMQWLLTAGYVAVGVLVIALLVYLAIRLLGSLDMRKVATVVHAEKTERADIAQFRPRLIRPRDPRGRVRYYYALFLRECKARGMELQPGSTGQEVAAQCLRFFPGADPEDLSAVYAPARYCSTQPVTPQQAEDAAKAWNRLRKTKYKPLKT